MSAQSEGKYAEALHDYYEAMRLEIDPYDQSIHLKMAKSLLTRIYRVIQVN